MIPKNKLREYARINKKLREVAGWEDILDDRERLIIRLRFRIDKPMTLQRVGELVGIKRERTRQIQDRAIGKLRKAKLI